MGKYGEAIGIMHIEVGGASYDLHPKKGDNYRLTKIMAESRKKNDEDYAQREMSGFIKDLIVRDYPPLSQEEKEELDMYIEFNNDNLMKEIMIAFRKAKREDLYPAEKKGDAEKK